MWQLWHPRYVYSHRPPILRSTSMRCRRKAANKLDAPEDVLPVPDNRRATIKVCSSLEPKC